MTRDEANFDPHDKLRETESPDADDAQSAVEPTEHEETPGTNDEGLGDFAGRPVDVPPDSPETLETPVDQPTPSAPSAAPTDASMVEPAQGNAPPVPEAIAWVGGRVDPSYCDLLKLVHGMHNPLELDDSGSIFEPPTNLSHGAPPGGAVPPFGRPQSSHGGPTVQVQVEVSVNGAGLQQISAHSSRRHAREAHDTIMIVARELYEFIEEVRTLEAQRRAIWDR